MIKNSDIYNQVILEIVAKVKDETNGIEKSDKLEYIENLLFESEYIDDIDAGDIYRLIDDILLRVNSKYGILEPLLNDEKINEIMVNGPFDIFIEKNGEISEAINRFLSEKELEDMIRLFASDVHREINEVNPIVDARLENGFRVNGVLKSVALNGPILTIRKFNKNSITMNQLIEFNTLTCDCANFLEKIVKSRYNIMISGSTSSGKTTFLNALAGFVDKEKERIIVIEDSAELKIENINNVVHMECKSSNSVGKGAVNMSMLIKTSLRMRPDRIIVGEVRGDEIKDMIQAMSTGHSGSMSTGHASSAMGMLNRLEAMYLMSLDIPLISIKKQIADSLEILIHLERDGKGRRKVVEVVELVDLENDDYITNVMYETSEEGVLVKTENDLKNDDKLKKWAQSDRL
ncbi:MAG TPA: ATPase, T2SS/T4P/T4SS family [Anaerovoracaceae bacterium]|nr:ATPase, T2SS/T4P/T4SS family [Anaerovoracaceae bacterium]